MSTLLDRAREVIGLKTRSYRLTFGSPVGRQVLADLAAFCHADDTTIVKSKDGAVDRDQSLVRQGRREVILRIQKMMRLSNDELYAAVNGPQEV